MLDHFAGLLAMLDFSSDSHVFPGCPLLLCLHSCFRMSGGGPAAVCPANCEVSGFGLADFVVGGGEGATVARFNSIKLTVRDDTGAVAAGLSPASVTLFLKEIVDDYDGSDGDEEEENAAVLLKCVASAPGVFQLSYTVSDPLVEKGELTLCVNGVPIRAEPWCVEQKVCAQLCPSFATATVLQGHTSGHTSPLTALVQTMICVGVQKTKCKGKVVRESECVRATCLQSHLVAAITLAEHDVAELSAKVEAHSTHMLAPRP